MASSSSDNEGLCALRSATAGSAKELVSTTTANTILDATPVKVTVISPLSNSEKGLAASRWASVPALPIQPAPKNNSTAPKNNSTAPNTKNELISTTTADTVLDATPVKVTVVNPISNSAKGLSASRWASSPALPIRSAPKTKNTTPEHNKVLVSTTTTDTVLDAMPVKVTVVNTLSGSDKGLAALRWASAPTIPASSAPQNKNTASDTNKASGSTTTAATAPNTTPTKVIARNPLGLPGLAASRWASVPPTPPTTPPPPPAPRFKMVRWADKKTGKSGIAKVRLRPGPKEDDTETAKNGVGARSYTYYP